MNAHFFRSVSILMLTAVYLWVMPTTASAAFTTTIEAPGVQTSQVLGVTTENFNSFGTGNYTTLVTAVGTLTSPGMAIVPANTFGGAGNVGNYFAIGAQSGQLTATLALNAPASYFGLWVSAIDMNNSMQFFSGVTLVGTFDANTSPFNSLPNTYSGVNNNNIDKFVYVNFTGTSGTTFDKIVFNNAILGSGFESDNWSVRSSPTTNAVPEPTTMTLGLIGTLMGAGIARLRRKTVVA